MAAKKNRPPSGARTRLTVSQDGVVNDLGASHAADVNARVLGTGARLRITAPASGFRRAGRMWQGVVEVPAGELTAEQIAQLKAEPALTVEEV